MQVAYIVDAFCSIEEHISRGRDHRDHAFVARVVQRCTEIAVIAGVAPCPHTRLCALVVWLVGLLADTCLNEDDRASLDRTIGVPASPNSHLRWRVTPATTSYRREVTRRLAHAYTVPGMAWSTKLSRINYRHVADSEERHVFDERIRTSIMVLRFGVHATHLVDVVVDADERVLIFQTHRTFERLLSRAMPATPPVS